MKEKTIFIGGALIAFASLLVGMLRCDSKRTEAVFIDDILLELLRAHPEIRTGYEHVDKFDNVIERYRAPGATESEEDAVKRASKQIEKHTDYYCAWENHWLTVIPKANSQRINKAMSIRSCSYPAFDGPSTFAFLRAVKVEADKTKTAQLWTGLGPYTPDVPDGPIKMPEGNEQVRITLAKVADQVSARCWGIAHSTTFTGDVEDVPRNLDVSNVDFYRPGELRYSVPQSRKKQ